ncbi:transcriptional regulator, IclR family [Parafrankia sp. EAN1pec]|uniref:IclR family transcriptional regulator n=1 Tax=Parafrankia sp. (strain EAN1pec) TaxID=298653 RepID=UPI0000540A23|nr:transcriptional regulator, IclR family [Frankia sp. EAN1pec]
MSHARDDNSTPASPDPDPNTDRNTPSRNQGSKTLARGLRALELVAEAETGMTMQDVADELGVHRTIAYRMLSTLEDFRLVAKDHTGRYHAAAGLFALAHRVQRGLREAVEPHLRALARELQSTVSLIAVEGDEAVAISVVEPPNAVYHISFRTGSRHPLDRGAAGHALRAAMPPVDGEPSVVSAARRQGFARTMGEVEPGAYGVAVPLPPIPGVPPACLNLITYRADLADSAVPLLLATVRVVNAELS